MGTGIRSDPNRRGTLQIEYLDALDPASRLGIRDRAMLYLGLTGGLRVSELVVLRLDDVRFGGRYVEVRVRGKGRKERALLLWKEDRDLLAR